MKKYTLSFLLALLSLSYGAVAETPPGNPSLENITPAPTEPFGNVLPSTFQVKFILHATNVPAAVLQSGNLPLQTFDTTLSAGISFEELKNQAAKALREALNLNIQADQIDYLEFVGPNPPLFVRKEAEWNTVNPTVRRDPEYRLVYVFLKPNLEKLKPATPAQ